MLTGTPARKHAKPSIEIVQSGQAGPMVSSFFHLKTHVPTCGPLELGSGFRGLRLEKPEPQADHPSHKHYACLGVWWRMAPGSAGPHPPVRKACSFHCSFHLTDGTSFPTKHREGPAEVVTRSIGYGAQGCHSCLSTRVLHLPSPLACLGSSSSTVRLPTNSWSD